MASTAEALGDECTDHYTGRVVVSILPVAGDNRGSWNFRDTW